MNLTGYNLNKESINAENFIQNIKSHYIIQDINIEIGILAAKIKSKFSIKLPDALLYATLDFLKGDYLITLDQKFYKKF